MRRYVLVTLCWFTLLFALYSLFLYFVNPATTDQPGINWERNQITSEAFAYDFSDAKAVVVGSSLAERLQARYLGEIRNLAFSGGSSSQGLSIIERGGYTPRVILVEANVLTQNGADQLTDSLFSSVPYLMKKYIPALRAKNRPEWVLRYFFRAAEVPEAARLFERSNRELQSVAISMRQDEAKAFPDRATNPEAFREWRARTIAGLQQTKTRYVEPLQARGAKIIFIELPMDERLWSLPTFYEPFNAAQAVFPPSDYKWIVFRDRHYDTGDGMHMVFGEAASVAEALRDQIDDFRP